MPNVGMKVKQPTPPIFGQPQQQQQPSQEQELLKLVALLRQGQNTQSGIGIGNLLGGLKQGQGGAR